MAIQSVLKFLFTWVLIILGPSALAVTDPNNTKNTEKALQVLKEMTDFSVHPIGVVAKLGVDAPQVQSFLSVYRNPRYQAMFRLLPWKYDIKGSRASAAIQHLVDQLYREIFSSPTGRHVCQISSGGSSKRLSAIFGISMSLADELKQTCTPTGQFQDYIKVEFDREYFFATSEEEDPVVGGWTNTYGVTLFQLKPQDISRAYLLRLMIHEMAMRLDEKEPNGFPFLLSFGRQTIKYVGKNQCTFMNSLSDLSVKYAFSSLRAEKLEDQILTELNVPVQTIPPEVVCGERALLRLPSIYRLKSIFQTEQDVLNQFNPCRQEESAIDPVTAIQTLSREKIIDAKNLTQTACEFLSTPAWGNFNFSGFSGGPRPPTGHGWGANTDAREILMDPSSDQGNSLRKSLKIIDEADTIAPGFQKKDLDNKLGEFRSHHKEELLKKRGPK